MFWKAYFVLYLALALFGVARYTNGLSHHTPVEWLDLLVFTPLAAASLFSRAYAWPSLPANAWRALLAASAGWVALVMWVGLNSLAPDRRVLGDGARLGGALIALLPSLPVLFGMYELGFGPLPARSERGEAG